MGQKNKRSQAAYLGRYPGTAAENQGSRSEHHRSRRGETAVIPASKRVFQREAGLDRHGVQWGRFCYLGSRRDRLEGADPPAPSKMNSGPRR